jgi:hypothetical protein
MRGRTKILLATNYEEAVSMWDKYKNNLLGIITDISFTRNGEVDKQAGIRFVEKVRGEDEYMPVLFQSTDVEYEARWPMK